MSCDAAICVAGLSKCYQIYDKPQDRLLQMLLRGRRQYYREFWALREISFEVNKGETVGIIGRNGSGKSTLLQLICGTLNPTSGFVKAEGRVAALLELGSGFNPEFSGRENIYMNAALLGLSREETDSRFEEIVTFADIGDFIDQPVKTYSSGMMVRLAFAVIAHVDADILIIDEALAVGDAFFTQKCMRFLRNFMKTGTTLFVSHDTSAVRSLCSRAIWLEKGEMLWEGHPKDVCESYLESFYEEQQGTSSTTRFRPDHRREPVVVPPVRDQRQEFLNHSNLRNDIAVFEFDPEAAAFGAGGAQVTSVRLHDGSGAVLSWIVGGENVTLRVEAVAHADLRSPIIGFFIKDRLGQCLFGDNTFLSFMDAPVFCMAGQTLVAEFSFQMPRLARGDYAMTVAVADGTQQEHVQHHWVHDAMIFKSESTSVSGGLLGIPMTRINLHTL
jgi:lipopolysaccharide transport system ATP-binding protein